MSSEDLFSVQLEEWLKSNHPKTLKSLTDVFAEKSFAITFLILMFPAALPLPTGGVTHLFEIITMLLSLELIIGRRTLWLPKRWQNLKFGAATEEKAVPFIIRRIRWFEKFSRKRLSDLISHPEFLRFVGLLVFILTLTAFFSPPFSGLDTLPALGVVIISLSLILEDIVEMIIGVLIGAAGVALTVGLSAIIVGLIEQIF